MTRLLQWLGYGRWLCHKLRVHEWKNRFHNISHPILPATLHRACKHCWARQCWTGEKEGWLDED